MSRTPLEELAVQVEQAAQRLGALRRARDEEIRRVVSNGASERQAARQASVSPSYAHRAAVNGRFASRIR